MSQKAVDLDPAEPPIQAYPGHNQTRDGAEQQNDRESLPVGGGGGGERWCSNAFTCCCCGGSLPGARAFCDGANQSHNIGRAGLQIVQAAGKEEVTAKPADVHAPVELEVALVRNFACDGAAGDAEDYGEDSRRQEGRDVVVNDDPDSVAL